MKGKKMRKLLGLLLSLTMVLSMVSTAYADPQEPVAAVEEAVAEAEEAAPEVTAEEPAAIAEEPAEEEELAASAVKPGVDPLQAQVASIQATVEPNFYGHKVSKIVIKFSPAADKKAIKKAGFKVYDRGTADPQFGELKIDSVKVSGQTVTLTVNKGTDKVTDRSRNTFGALNTTGWFMDLEGNIYCGNEQTTDALGNTIYPNKAGKTCQGRNLDLILTINDTDITNGIMSTDGHGQPLKKSVWKDTKITGGLEKVDTQYVNVGWECADYELVSDDGEVPVQVIWPKNYKKNRKEPYPVIVYQCGGGVCYWQLPEADESKGLLAPAHNLGCNTVYDNMMTEWATALPEAIVMGVNVHSSNTENAAKEIAGVLDYAIKNWNADADKIIGVGNSQGTIIFSDVIRQRPDLVAGFVECNGDFGTMCQPADLTGKIENSSLRNWTKAEVQAMLDNDVAVWLWNGETDSNPATAQDTIEIVRDLQRREGKSESWIYNHLRISGLQSWKFMEWGETDHSVTKVVAWNYLTRPYNDVTKDGRKLKVGDTYQFSGEIETYQNYQYTMDYYYTVYAESVSEWARNLFNGVYDEDPQPKDLDEVTVLEKDFSQAAQLPLTGYFTKNFDVNGEARTAKVYIANEASVRTYFTVVAVPDGVDTTEFLTEEGWFDVADAKGEALYVLEPGKDGWGSAKEEAEYVKTAINFLKSGVNANNVTVFSVFGEYYLAGYGKGAAALELWAAENSIFVISQMYIDGTSAGNDALAEVSGTLVGGTSPNGDISDVLDDTIARVGIAGRAAAKDFAVPTWLVKYTGSEDHWFAANNAKKVKNGTSYQKIDAANYSTDYANSRRKAAGETTGLSKVVIQKGKAPKAAEIYAQLSAYTRYDNTFAYSNALADRLDYTSARVAAQKAAKFGDVKFTLSNGADVWASEDVKLAGHGTVQVGVMAFADNNGDGVNDPREYILFIPEGYEGKKLPILQVYPGNSQTDSIFLDSTLWWQLTEDEGIALAFICETYSANACSVSHANSDLFYESINCLLAEKIDGVYADLDFTRIYGTGQSAGSSATQGFAMTNPEFFAAVASTSAAPAPNAATASYQPIPTMLIVGQMDGASSDGFASANLQKWGNYMLEVNGTGATFAADTADDVLSTDPRHPEIYSWNNPQGIPVVRWAQCLLRPHNCYPSDMVNLWEFAKHYAKDENGVRYYSASGFEKDDAVVLKFGTTMDDVETLQAYTDGTIYGTGLVNVEITYAPGTDLSAITADSYILEDRGSLNPEYGEIRIADAKVEGNTVTLTISNASQATANNRLVYGGADKEGPRERNAFGIYCTGAWYRDVNGIIYYGNDDNDAYENNTTGMGYQARHCLELKLRHVGEAAEAAACLSDDKGEYNAEGKWLPTVDRQFGPGGFRSFAELGIQIESTANTGSDGTQDPYVEGYAYIPENYDPARGLVVVLQGQGISYWQLPDGTNNAGCGIMYDTATTSWKNTGAIVLNIHDRSSALKGEYWENYDFVIDDCNVMKYFIEKYGITGNIVLQGNSRGTMACSAIIKALAGQNYHPFEQEAGWPDNSANVMDRNIAGQYDFDVDVFVCQNGQFGAWNCYKAEDYQAVAKTGMKLWCIDGEQDTNNIDNVAAYKDAITAIGGKVEDYDIRLTALASDIFYYWGETDHSVTRIVGWYFPDTPYYGTDVYVDENGEIAYGTRLSDGETYTVKGRGNGIAKAGYEYVVYDEPVHSWALQAEAPTPEETMTDKIVSIQAITGPTFYGTAATEVVVTYEEGTDLSGITAESYILEDRGSLTPDFGQVDIESVKVEGNVATITLLRDFDATEINAKIYTGSGEKGSRQRNSYGVYVTGSWYRDGDKVIRYGKDDNDAYENNTTGMGYQARECLEFKLRHAGEPAEAAECLANDLGEFNAEGKWLPTIDTQFGEDGFKNLYDLQIESTASKAAVEAAGGTPDGSCDEYVQGYYYVPENYDPANGIIFTLQGQGISFWQLPDGSNCAGTGFRFDTATWSWKNKGAIVVNIHDRSSASQLGDYKLSYDYVTDDVRVMKYFIDEYKITGNVVVQGNSRGTMASNNVIAALAGLEYKKNGSGDPVTIDKTEYDFTVDTYICQNGTMGGNYWSDWNVIADTGLKVWAFDGEQDTNNIDTIKQYKDICTEKYGAAWAEENVRLTGYTSELYYPWGESDHSTTRINGWYFANAAYYGSDLYVDEKGEIVYNTKLADGDTYVLDGNGSAAESNKMGYAYTVYDDVFQEWAFVPAPTSVPSTPLEPAIPNIMPIIKTLVKQILSSILRWFC